MTTREPREAVCPGSGWKIRHPDRAAARAALAHARATSDERRDRKTPRAIYRCGLCDGGFHLTSQSRRQYLMWPGRSRRAT